MPVPDTPVSADTGSAAKVFAARPWNDLDAASISGAALAVPTMLSAEEQALYFWLGAVWARGEGTVVDLGCFAGGSTARLADGLRLAGRATAIHAYDRFTASEKVKARVLYPRGIEPFDGTDILPLAQRLLAEWAPAVSLHPGDIATQHWAGGPIEILVLDASKTTSSSDRVAETFFPALIPGRSVVVQQDFLHWRQPWLPVQMQLLAGCFRPLAFCPKDTVAFLCTRVPGTAELAAARTDGLGDGEMIAHLRAAMPDYERWSLRHRLRRQIKALRRNPGQRVAWKFRSRPGPPGAPR